MPSFNPFGSVTGRTSASLFEIRLDNDIIVLRGGENEASSQLLKGTVVLCVPSLLKIEDVHLRMMGQLRIGWNDQKITPTGVANNRVERTTEIFSHRWPPFVGPGSNSRGTSLPTGNYEWPFELVIPGKMAESVEGLADSHIIYKLKATVARGKLAYDLHASKAVRIVRTLDPSALELAHTMTVENVWPNKIEYRLVIPQKAIIFGTAIDVEMRFTSLLKGLRIGTIKCVLIESQEFSIPGATTHTERFFKSSRDVGSWSCELKDEHYHDLLDETGQDGYSLKERMPLPKTLHRCLQDVDSNGIKIRHKVKFNVALHNPDGHVSELRATLPVTIFISPNMPLTEQGLLVDQTPMSTETFDMGQHAPPLYEHHQLDQLYADVVQSGIMTPHPQSGMNTPFYSQSRAGSSENLAVMNGDGVHSSGAVPPGALSTRLQNLNNMSRNNSFHNRGLNHSGSGGNTPHGHAHHDSESCLDGRNHSGQASGHSSMPRSRRTSEEASAPYASGYHTPEHIDYSDLGDLTKVPSYRTALKTPVRGMSYTEALPNYETAVSAPPSPIRGVISPVIPGGLEHLSNGFTGHQMATMGFTPIHPPPAVYMPSNIGDGDERRRLHVLQTRGRAQ